MIKDPVLHQSPLAIIGVITPMAIFFFWASGQLPSIRWTPSDWIFTAWAGLMILNAIYFYLTHATLPWMGVIIKITLPVYLYPFLRHQIRSRKDLNGIMMTCLVSSFIPIATMIYELLFSPIQIQISRGLERVTGGYADVFNYSIYFLLFFISAGYFSLKAGSSRSRPGFAFFTIAVSLITLVGVYHLHHLTSLIIFTVLVLLLWAYQLVQGRLWTVALFVNLILILVLVYHAPITDHLTALLDQEMAVIQGEAEITRAFHGRVDRWRDMWTTFTSAPVLSKAIGPVFAHLRPVGYMITGSHNDYLRILFLSGGLGLVLYLGFIFRLFMLSMGLSRDIRFLAHSSLLVLILFSMTSAPSIYAPLMYVVLSVFATIARQEESRS
jgi:O-antigen ligase